MKPTCQLCDGDLVDNTDMLCAACNYELIAPDACPDCGKPADLGCHDLCPSDTPQLSEDEIGVAPW